MTERTKYELRLDLLGEMNILMNNWDGTADSAEDIISENEKNIMKLKKNENTPNNNGSLLADDTETKLVKSIIHTQKQMVHQIKIQREKLVNQSKQLSQKDKVIKNYVSVALAPMFVDKGL